MICTLCHEEIRPGENCMLHSPTLSVVHTECMTPTLDKRAKDVVNKPRLAYTFRSTMEAIAIVREYGNRKYGDPNNWKQVDEWEWYEAALRHLTAAIEAIRYTETSNSPYDKESGIFHVAHAQTCLMFIIERWTARGNSLQDKDLSGKKT